ncbi:MAG: FtsX-like permease family protein [Chloroflexi bacterium]|nr:FtsX-like permease family protein [Chloroflexota bacterium]
MLKTNPRWKKAIRDLWLNKTRTLLVVLAISIGILGMGTVLVGYSILTRELQVNYMKTNPASATLWADSLDRDLVQAVQTLPAIQDAEARRLVRARVQMGENEWLPIDLFVIDDFQKVRVSTFKPEQGAPLPAQNEILIERVALPVLKSKIGDVLTLKTPNGAPQNLRIAGTVHDPGQAPAWMEQRAYGYITPDTLQMLGELRSLNELKIVVARDALNEVSIRQTAYELKTWLESSGRRVERLEVPAPGEHPHIRQMDSLLFLFEAFGVLAFALSTILVINMIAALLAQQVRQIGVMKAIGGSTRQAMSIYLSMVVVLGLTALVIAMPLTIWLGMRYADFVAGILNFKIYSYEIPTWVFAILIGLGWLAPILAAAYPIYRGSQITAREAMSDYGVGQGSFGRGAFDSLLGRLRGRSRPLLLSLRNTFRRRGRLVLTLFTLAIGGTMLIVAMNISASIDKTVDRTMSVHQYDVEILFNRAYSKQQIEQVIGDAPGVTRVETWGQIKALPVRTDGTHGNEFSIISLPPKSEMLNLEIVDGRWLVPGDQNAIVLNHGLVAELKERDPQLQIKAGDQVTLGVNGKPTQWHVVGIAREVAVMPRGFASYDYVANLTGQAGLARRVGVRTEKHDAKFQKQVLGTLEARFESAGMKVENTLTLAGYRIVIEEHLMIIVAFLILMSIFIVAVGGLGLMLTMSINIIERTREIGVMRAIGASGFDIIRVVMVEAVLIGVLSWLIAIVLAPPTSMLIGNIFGTIFFAAPLEFAISINGSLLWLVIVIVFAPIASFLPAWKASQLPTSQVLAYE